MKTLDLSLQSHLFLNEIKRLVKRHPPMLYLPKGSSLPSWTEKEGALIRHIEKSIQHAEKGESELNPAILALEGYSSEKVRHPLNNLCSKGGTRYFEIGTWKGSTFISALYGNQEALQDAVAIDDWSEFGGPERDFRSHCAQFLSKIKHRFYAEDCFSIEPKDYFSEPVNLYFYDGNHSTEHHERAFTYFNEVFADPFIAVIDDWNAYHVRQGTFQAFHKLDYKIAYERVLPAKFSGDKENWWNGIYLAVIRKDRQH